MQQDAEECYTAILQAFRTQLKAPFDETQSLIDHLFAIELKSTVQNTECAEEPVEIVSENLLKLPCHIDNMNNPVNHLSEGLKVSLEGELEKNS